SRIFGFEGCDIICANDTTEDPTLYLSTARIPGHLNYAKDSAQVLAVATFSDNADTDENEKNPHYLEVNSDQFDEPFDLSQTGPLVAEFEALSTLKGENNEISLAYSETGSENSFLTTRGIFLIIRHSDSSENKIDNTGDKSTTSRINTTGQTGSDHQNGSDTSQIYQNVTGEQTLTVPHQENTGILDTLFALIMSLFGWETEENSPLPSGTTTTPADDSAGTLTEEPIEMTIPSGYEINLRSAPPGSLIYLDGVYTGTTTPETLSFQDADPHNLKLVHEGYADYLTELSTTTDTNLFAEMYPADQRIYAKTHIDLAAEQSIYPNTGSLYIRNAIKGAEVLIDSKETSRVTPTLITGLREGWHTVKLKGYDSSTLSSSKFWVFPESVTEVYLRSDENDISISLLVNSSAYESCYLSLNGDYLHKKIPLTISSGAAGDLIAVHTQNDEYISKKITGSDLSSGTVWFDEYTSTLSDIALVSDPAGAHIFVDGFETGYETPYTIHNLSAGTHIISISKEGYYPSEGEIRLIDHADNQNVGIVRCTLNEYPSGSLFVTSDIPGQKIYLYDRYTGEKTPHLFTRLDLGNYPVKLVSDTTTYQYEITIGPYETTYLNQTGA
ncbi:MAG: PEGA domain-containing protein, partial [Sphaerochaetaceae bacterium]|nr:PEGA domain-containing protein [Sphaerochaetaceae bacterium]